MADEPAAAEPVAPAEVLPAPTEPGPAPTATAPLPPGVQPSRNYLAAVELGHVLAASGYYTDATEPAKAAVKVMIGMDIGISPTAALQGIHTMDENGRTVFLIETKLLAAVVKARPDVEYQILKRNEEEVEAEFLRRGEDGEWAAEGPNIKWTIADAKKAVKGFDKKPTWKGIPAVMLTWRVLAEGFRLYFPDVLAGQPIYTLEEFDADADDVRLKEALAPAKPPPLADAKAEGLRDAMREVFDEIKEVNPDRLVAGRFAQMIAGAEHSHARLEAVLASLEDLRDTEKRIAELAAELEGLMGVKEAEPIIARAERRGSNRERIDVLEQAIAGRRAAEAEATPAGEGDEYGGDGA